MNEACSEILMHKYIVICHIFSASGIFAASFAIANGHYDAYCTSSFLARKFKLRHDQERFLSKKWFHDM